MRSNRLRRLCGLAVISVWIVLPVGAQAPDPPAETPEPPADPRLQMVDSPIGRIESELGVPTEKGARKIYGELDFQRACQAYLWALPLVGYAEWQHAGREVFGAGDADVVVYTSIADKLGMLTPNATTPYFVGMPDLSKTGPLVIDYPAGPTAGGVADSWQRPISDLGETGPDKGKGAKYLIVGPGQNPPADVAGYKVLRSPTFNVFFGYRILERDPAKAKVLQQSFRLYPYRDRAKPPATRFLSPQGKPWSQMPPRGFAYWERLHEIMQREPVLERDRVMLGMLKSLGIEKGDAFQPDDRQRRLLEEGAVVGEQMSKALSYRSRIEGTRYSSESRWEVAIAYDPSQETPNYTQVDERANYFYVAVGSTEGMATKTPGVGQGYLSVYQDREGHAFDGGKTYKLHVPPEVPAKLFWSVTVYDVDTRTFFPGQEIVDRSSRGELAPNPDGSVDIIVGPTAPAAGQKGNWIPSVPGKAWFALFRLYGPLQPYFEGSWPLPDFELVP